MEQTSITKRYNNIIVDTVNLFYKVWDSKGDKQVLLSQKLIYKDTICRFIKRIDYLKKTYLHSDGRIWLLFDNYFSRADLQTVFTYADRKKMDEAYKATRKKENKPFYQSLNFIRYYYMIGPSDYYTARLDGLEADDLVKPLIESGRVPGTSLFVTTDLDWARYLSEDIDCLGDFSKGPKTIHDISFELGFPVSETSIIVYKSLFGDKSDNISGIITNNEVNFNEFKQLLPEIKFPDKLIYMARRADINKRTPIFKAVTDNERQYEINSQLVSTIACSKEAFNSCIEEGKMETTLYKIVRQAIGLDPIEQKFTFGNVKRPRK